MSDVDYESWADYIDECMQTHHPDPIHVMELASGTGNLILSLAELECYILTGSDGSPEMVELARLKTEERNLRIPFEVQDFRNLKIDHPKDVIFSVFDSINYLLKPEYLNTLLADSFKALKQDGLFIFDFSTPKNSLEAVDFLNNEEGDIGSMRYHRTSEYDTHTRIHTNRFEIEQLDPESSTVLEVFEEVHQQRAYTLNEILSIVRESPYNLIASYDGFDMIPANENSTRVTMILQCQKQP